MADKHSIYQSKLGTIQGALDRIQSGDSIVVPGWGNEPYHFMSTLHTIAPRVRDVTLWTALILRDYQLMTDTSLKGAIDIYTHFYNRDCRAGHASGRYHYAPSDLHFTSVAALLAQPCNVFVAAVSPMDEHGKFYMPFDLGITREALDHAATVILEVNHSIPRVFGDTAIPVEWADYIYEADTPLPVPPEIIPSETDRKIAENVASLIQDGDCLQIGIGGITDAVGALLMDKQDLGIFTELITPSMGKLIEAGVVTNARKNFCNGKTIGAYAYGDQTLYDYMTDNVDVTMRRAAWVNNPANIARNDNMVSINTAIQIDLTGQICSESMGSRHYSGTGGALDFAYGALHSKGGRGIMAIHSTAKGGTVSKIQAQLTPGAAVSVPRNSADYIITEYGIAPLRGRSLRQRVENLIAISHPDFRAELRRQADALMLW